MQQNNFKCRRFLRYPLLESMGAIAPLLSRLFFAQTYFCYAVTQRQTIWIINTDIYFLGNVAQSQRSEDSSLTTPLNLSTKEASPNTPDSPSSLIFDFKKEKLFPIKREENQSPILSPSRVSPDPMKSPMSSLPVKDSHSPSPVTSLWSTSSAHTRIWSPLVEDTKRIWSPAVSCEKENNSTNNNNNSSGAKVLVEVRCGGCGDVTSQFRPDTSARCHNCTHPHQLSQQARPERIFKVGDSSIKP